jgi:hypothetical protein
MMTREEMEQKLLAGWEWLGKRDRVLRAHDETGWQADLVVDPIRLTAQEEAFFDRWLARLREYTDTYDRDPEPTQETMLSEEQP